MKNLSKVLAVVLALVMALSMVSFAAYTDVADDANYAEAVSVLSALDMLKGYEDGTFKPEGDITRAEFAMVVCRLLGYGAAAETPASYAPFNDVPADHWASGAIALAAQQKIVNGYGDGNFGPEDNVTYEQAIKMVVAALGYTIVAESNGGYPGGFQIVAAQAGILDGITDGKAGVAASRGVVAQLAYNALEVPMMAQVGFGSDVKYDYDNTLLLNRIGVVKVEADILGTAKSDGSLKADEVGLRVGRQFAAAKSNNEAGWYTIGVVGNPLIKPDLTSFAATSEIKATEDAIAVAEAYMDCKVEAYVKDATTRNAKLVAIAAKDAGYSEIAFATEDIDTTKTNLGLEDLAIYTDETKEKSEVYDVNVTRVYLNGREFSAAGTTATALSTASAVFASFIDTTAEADIKLLDSDSDGIYNIAYITSYADYVVKRIYEKDYELISSSTYVPTKLGAVYTSDSYGSSLVLDEEDETCNFEIIKDGEKISFADIAVNDVLSVAGYVDNAGKLKFGTVVVNTQSVTGKVDGLDDTNELISVDGVEYPYNGKIANEIRLNNVKVTLETTFYINARGVICGYDTEAKTTNLKYGYATVAVKDGSRDFAVRLLDSEGTWNTYGTASKIYVNSPDTALTDTALATFGTAVSVTPVDDEVVLNRVVAYELNADGEIKKLYTEDEAGIFVDDTTYASTAEAYNSISESIGSFIMSNSVIIFSVNSEDAVIDEEEVKVVGKDALVHASKYTFTAYNVEDGEPAVICGKNIIGKMDWSADFMVISSKTQTVNANEELGVEITGLVNGEVVTIFASNDNCSINEIDYTAIDNQYKGTAITHTALEAGDVIMFSAEAGEASQIVRVIDGDVAKTALDNATIDLGSAVKLGTTTAVDVTYTWYLGYVSNLTSNGIVLVNGSATTTPNTPISLKNDPATTEVDFFVPGRNGNKTVVTNGNEGSFRADTGLENADTARNDGDIVLVRATNSTLAESAVVFKAKD